MISGHVEGFRLSPQQAELWQRQGEDGALRLVQVAAQIDGAVPVAAWQAALQAVVAQHEILRTTFGTVAEVSLPLQVIPAPAPLPITPLALADAAPATIAAALAAQRAAPFDLTRGPLLRVGWATLSPTRQLLLLTAPALIADRAGLAALVAQLHQVAVGSAAADGAALQYADCAEWHYELRDGPAAAAGRAWWATQAPLAPGGQLPGQPAAPGAGARQVVPVACPPALAAQIQELAAAAGVGPDAVVLSAWAALLHTLSGQTPVRLGLHVAGRPYPELVPVPGRCAQVLPLRLPVALEQPFRALLAQTAATAELAASWQMCFRWAELGVPPHAVPPALPWTFAWEAAPAATTAGGVTVQLVALAEDPPPGTLGLVATADGPALRLALHATGGWDAAALTRLAAQLHTLLTSATATPTARLGQLGLVGADEQRELLVTLNATERPLPPPVAIHRLVEAQAARQPTAVAVVGPDATLSYGALNAQANQLARELRELGVGPDTVVGLLAGRSAALVVGLLAVLKAGGAYLPLDPSYPAARLHFMLADAGAGVLLTEPARRGDLPGYPGVVRDLDAPREERARSDLADGPEPEHLAYLIYTSGSTGQPKGVAVSHAQLVHSTQARTEVYGAGPGRFLVLSSVAFDSSIAGLFWTLGSGGAVVLPADDAVGAPAALNSLIAATGVTHLLTLPSVYQLLLDAADAAAHVTLRTVIVAGEACPATLVAQHAAQRPATGLWNEYGPTEHTVWTTVYRCRGDEGEPVPIGRPIANTRIRLLNGEGALVPRGVVGELHISGVQLARGYYGQPALTAERFRPDPWSATPGARLYRTGDLARYLADGTLAFVGRVDQQVKLRGYRIELGEIEAVLRGQAEVREAVVTQHVVGPGDGRLVAYVVGAPGARLRTGALRAAVAAELPGYMVPAVVVVLGALPQTPNGKVDRGALPVPDWSRPELEAPYVAPRTALEAELAAVWAEVLGVEQVGVEDNFFQLGGHSLLATQLLARLRERYGLELAVRRIFEVPTVAGLAAVIQEAELAAADPEALRQLLAEVEGAEPVTENGSAPPDQA